MCLPYAGNPNHGEEDPDLDAVDLAEGEHGVHEHEHVAAQHERQVEKYGLCAHVPETPAFRKK